jgi:non-ribosomal peptide synthetase component F
MVLLFGSELGLASSLLLEQRLVLGLELGVDERTPLLADLPLQFARAAESIPEAPARLPTNIPVRHGLGYREMVLWSEVIATHFTSRTLSRSTGSGFECPDLSGGPA